jgi:hypothetical protein
MIRTTSRPVIALLAAAVLAASADLARAHAPDPPLASGGLDQDQVLTFRWRSGAEPPSAFRSAILAAATDVAETRRSRAALFEYRSGASNPIGYGSGATCGTNGIACFTRTLPSSFTMWFRPQGHVFDWGTLKWCQAYATAPNGCYDVENIALDEFGHIEGLAHHVNYSDNSDYLDAVVQTYSRTKPNDGWNKHTFGPCDVATLQKLYDIQTTAQKYSTCLDLATVMTMTSTATTVPSGGSVTLTATLRVVDLDSYGLVGNNLVSKRVVRLQRRLVGATTWTTAGTMTAGASGTYTLGAVVNAATELRAQYKATSDEGLRGDVSPVVTVATSGCTRPPC